MNFLLFDRILSFTYTLIKLFNLFQKMILNKITLQDFEHLMKPENKTNRLSCLKISQNVDSCNIYELLLTNFAKFLFLQMITIA